MSSVRRAWAVLAAVGFLGGLSYFQVAVSAGEPKAPPVPARAPVIVAQKRVNRGAPRPVVAVPGGPNPAPALDEPPDNPSFSDALTLPTDRQAKRKITLADDFITENDWAGAAEALQKLLDSQEDVFVEVPQTDPHGKPTTGWKSIRLQANLLLGTLPAEGLEVYELKYGARAKALLNEARAKGDPQMLAEVAQKYLHTEAGAEATNLLGTYYLDRGGYVMAALCYERLLNHPSAGKLPALTLFKAALAFRRAGEQVNADHAWDLLAKNHPEGLRLGDQLVSLDRLHQELVQASLQGSAGLSRSDWPMWGGNAARSAQGYGGAPYLDDQVWPAKQTVHLSQTRTWIEETQDNQRTRGQPVIPAFCPIAATIPTDKGPLPLVIYRTYEKVCAVDARNGEVYWDTLPLLWGLDNLLADPNKQMILNQWRQFYIQASCQNVVYENSVLGTMSTDNSRVYVIDDLALPPHPNYMQQFQWGNQPTFGALKDGVNHNTLEAFELDSGKLAWEVGGKEEDKNDLSGSFFLGPPLPLGGKLYVLNEKKSELRLLCLDPLKKGAVTWTQTLANVKDSLLQDVGRRVQAAQLAYGEGILVCPTNAGAILGVDLLTHSLVWAHSYRQPAPTNPAIKMGGMMVVNPQVLSQDWKASTPIIAEGKVVFTAPDGTLVHCLNLRDGQPLWTANRTDDLYVGGVYNGKVILVGRNSCRALNLTDGKQVWRQDALGTPSGQGVASKNVYYLPLKEGRDKEPEVCALNIDTGAIIAHSKSRKKLNGPTEIPGNLLFFEGDVISQTTTTLTAYPQLDVIRAQIDEHLRKNPQDPVGLTNRGEIKLDEGDWNGAVEDLRTALAHKPPPEILPKTRAKLFETFSELFNRDFAANEKYLDEFKELCQVPARDDALPEERQKAEEEQQRRQADFLCLVAKGREKQGRLLEAFQAYEDFGALNGNRELVTVMDEPSIKARPDVWAQGRIAAMIAKATPEQRKPLEDKIADQWRAVQGTQDTEALRHFVAVFGSLFTNGKEARLELAERLMEENSFLEAEQNLLQLTRQDDLQLAARSYEMLARLNIRKGLMKDAAYYYRILGTRYADVPVRDGKTGADLWNDLATDKRFLPYLDDLSQVWNGRFKAKDVYGSYNQMQQVFYFEPEGEVLPFFQEHRVALVNNNQLKVINRTTNEEVWSQTLAPNYNQMNHQYLYSGYQNIHFPYHVEGHLVVLSLGPNVFAFDPVDRKAGFLWEKNLAGSAGQPTQYQPDQNGGLNAIYADGFIQRLGRTGPIEPSYICLQSRQGLMALDPLQGTTLWSKADVSPHAQVFGDDQYLYLVDNPTGGGSVGVGKALRARDGVSVDVPEFTGLYQRRLALLGRNLLLSETDPQEHLVLRLYDVQTGKDLWHKEFAPKSRIIHTEEPELAGVVEPANGGKVTIFDLRSRKEVLVTRIEPKELDKLPEDGVHGVYLLQDNDFYYLVVNGPPDQVANPWGGPWNNLNPGMRSMAVNGNIYAFDKTTGKLRWKPVEPLNQMIVLDQFKDLPILLCTSRTNKPLKGPGGFNQGAIQVVETVALDKRTGKLVYLKEVQNGPQFFTLSLDQRAKTIELIGYNLKIEFSLEAEKSKERSARGNGGESKE